MIKIYGADWCGPCNNAKKLCEDRHEPYTFVSVDSPEGTEVMAINNWRSIPQIFINETYIGGYTDLLEYFNGQDQAESD